MTEKLALIPDGPSPSYKYPTREKVILGSTNDILTKLTQELASYG